MNLSARKNITLSRGKMSPMVSPQGPSLCSASQPCNKSAVRRLTGRGRTWSPRASPSGPWPRGSAMMGEVAWVVEGSSVSIRHALSGRSAVWAACLQDTYRDGGRTLRPRSLRGLMVCSATSQRRQGDMREAAETAAPLGGASEPPFGKEDSLALPNHRKGRHITTIVTGRPSSPALPEPRWVVRPYRPCDREAVVRLQTDAFHEGRWVT